MHSFVANFVSYICAKYYVELKCSLFKLVFISHFYHEGNRGELSLKHGVVFRVINSTEIENEHSNGCDPSGCNGIIAMSAFTAQELARVTRGK